MRKLENLILLGGLCGVLGVTGCQSSGHQSSDRTEGRALDDKHITERVQNALKSEPTYKFTDVGVKTFGGIVQLNGFVTTEDQRRRAGEIAQNTQGVNQVVNNIVLKQETPTPTGRPNPPPPASTSSQAPPSQ
jgi:osmotically-inducible protein OsmY